MRSILFIIVLIGGTHLSWSQVNNATNAPLEEEKESAPAVMETESREQEEYKNDKRAVTGQKAKSSEVLKKAEAPSVDDLDVSKDQMLLKESAFLKSSEESRYQRTQRTPTPARQAVMSDAVSYFEQKSPQSFEFHYFKYLSGNYNTQFRDHLLQAEKIRPENSDVHVQLVALYEIEDQKDVQESYLLKLAESGRISKSTLNYAEDVILSSGQHNYLIAHAMEDAIALWYQQSIGGLSEDVDVLSLDLFQSEAYRKQLRQKGLKLPESKTIDTKYLEQFLHLNASKKIGLSLTIPKEYFTAISNDIYVNGLTFTYSEVPLLDDNNAYLWNSSLRKHLIDNPLDEKGKQLSANYLPMLLKLKERLEREQKEKELKEIDGIIQHVVIQSRKQGTYSKVKQ